MNIVDESSPLNIHFSDSENKKNRFVCV